MGSLGENGGSLVGKGGRMMWKAEISKVIAPIHAG
jgi:hypothetical protein